ncbi:hypothetical protein SO802_016014 [Lithocarpus litseifolius]|uniref:Uncharacterized protein n=1 Tax=Lithocarpus litseifolius TaxID=425828 RepID=A0AAW2CXG9_9ROSI
MENNVSPPSTTSTTTTISAELYRRRRVPPPSAMPFRPHVPPLTPPFRPRVPPPPSTTMSPSTCSSSIDNTVSSTQNRLYQARLILQYQELNDHYDLCRARLINLLSISSLSATRTLSSASLTPSFSSSSHPKPHSTIPSSLLQNYKQNTNESVPKESSSKGNIGELINLSFPSLEQVKIESFLRTDNALNFVRILEKQELVLEDIELIPAKVAKDLIPRY